MTHAIAQRPVQAYASAALPPPVQERDPSGSIRSASITAGVGLLLMSALAGFGKFVALDGLVTEGNAAQTAQDVMASEGLFRLGVASLVLVVALDVVVAWALYRVFSPVSKSISMLAAAMRLVYAGVFMVAISELLAVILFDLHLLVIGYLAYRSGYVLRLLDRRQLVHVHRRVPVGAVARDPGGKR